MQPLLLQSQAGRAMVAPSQSDKVVSELAQQL